jgi:hypothetical protein
MRKDKDLIHRRQTALSLPLIAVFQRLETAAHNLLLKLSQGLSYRSVGFTSTSMPGGRP